MYQNNSYRTNRKPVERKGVNRPEAVYQMQGADVAVWKNTRRKENNELEVFYKATLNGTYTDSEGKRRFTQGVVIDDIPAAIEGLKQAYEKYYSIDDKVAKGKESGKKLEQREPKSKEKAKGLEKKV